MGCGQTFGEVYSQPYDLSFRQLSASQLFAEGFPGDVLHYQIVHSFLAIKVVDDGDTGMTQPGKDSCFFMESLARRFVVYGTWGKNLDSDIAVEVLVVGAIDFPHAALSDLLEDAVVSQRLPQ